MKTNLSIELDDNERNHIAHILDGKPTKRLVTRNEVVAIASGAVQALLDRPKTPEALPQPAAPPPVAGTPRAVVTRNKNIPCERPTTEKDFPAIVADWYTRAKQADPTLASHIIWDAEKRGIKIRHE
jgi:hypothetical protein